MHGTIIAAPCRNGLDPSVHFWYGSALPGRIIRRSGYIISYTLHALLNPRGYWSGALLGRLATPFTEGQRRLTRMDAELPREGALVIEAVVLGHLRH